MGIPHIPLDGWAVKAKARETNNISKHILFNFDEFIRFILAQSISILIVIHDINVHEAAYVRSA